MDNIDEDLKKKIESTKFVYMVAKSGVGKTFSGDYLEAIRGWKHIDGDIILKGSESNSEYKDATEQMISWIEDRMAVAAQGEELVDTGGWKTYFKIMARLTLEGARDSDTVVITHATSHRFRRDGLRQHLIDAGAKDVSTVFLHCDFDAHMQALWKRYNRLADQGGITIEEHFKSFDMPGIVDFDSFVEQHKHFVFEEPDESEQPYKMVDVTAKDVTTLDGLDEAFGIENNKSRGDGTYDEMAQKIMAVDKKRDQDWMDSKHKAIEDSEAEKEPKKLNARRSMLLQADMYNSIRRLSSMSLIQFNPEK